MIEADLFRSLGWPPPWACPETGSADCLEVAVRYGRSVLLRCECGASWNLTLELETP